MTIILDPKESESVYDPTCGTGGMLLGAALHLKELGSEYRTLKLYGQDINLITSSIARINFFLHGIDDFEIVRGDTLSSPAFIEHDELKRFDVALANPPYSIKKWNREAFISDAYGRNLYGVPPQGRADFAFFQHIIKSLNPKTGRCAILFPHGVLFRDAEQEIRKNVVEADVIECVLGLGPNLFYNSPMYSCIVVCRMQKRPDHRGKILVIDASKEVTKEKTQSFLEDRHCKKIVEAYKAFRDVDGFSKVISSSEVHAQNENLSVQLYVRPKEESSQGLLRECISKWDESVREFENSFNAFIVSVNEMVTSE